MSTELWASDTSLLDLFTIGIGPSSSHSVGPMRAAQRFAQRLVELGRLDDVWRIVVDLFGSLALTGRGHGTDRAVLMGLEGHLPEEVDPAQVGPRLEVIRSQGELNVTGRVVPYDESRDLVFHRRESLPRHPNGMRFSAFNAGGDTLLSRVVYSLGGGFLHEEPDEPRSEPAGTTPGATDDSAPTSLGNFPHVPPRCAAPHPFARAQDLLRIADETGLPWSGIALANEGRWRSEAETLDGLRRRWHAMRACVERGCQTSGVLPGGLQVRRRAAQLFEQLAGRGERTENGPLRDPLETLDWVDMYALAVNEENAAGGRVVTAPTNGAAGIIPAVLHYYLHFCAGADEAGVLRALLTAGVIGLLYKTNASISGAEVGCQGEVGVACSMAAGGLTEALGGTPRQVEQAAEIGMEHNLGLTCDPVGGLVQVPCIERNAMAAVKAINASRLALRSDGRHHISLDRVIDTMRRTGRDMSSKYKETSRGGLAVNFTEC